MRLIDADALKEWECEKCEYENKDESCRECCGVMQRIDESPTIDALPVKRGKWEKKRFVTDEGEFVYACSECGYQVGLFAHNRTDFCPSCGAKMDGE